MKPLTAPEVKLMLKTSTVMKTTVTGTSSEDQISVFHRSGEIGGIHDLDEDCSILEADRYLLHLSIEHGELPTASCEEE